MYLLERSVLVPRPRQEVFRFFEDPNNLAEITPPEMGFRIDRIDDSPVRAGFRIEYTIKVMRLPIRWRTLITDYDPPQLFADIQEKGPYKSWRHEHRFTDVDGQTVMSDRVQYELPFGILGSVTHRLMVEGQLEDIFDYRARRIREIFTN